MSSSSSPVQVQRRYASGQTPRVICPPGIVDLFAQNTIEIEAKPLAVWSQLIECVQWPSWYKYRSDVSVLRGGPPLSANAKFRFKTLRLYFEPEIQTFDPPRMLVCSAKGPVGTSGAHAWYIEPTLGGYRVIREEVQSGLLLILLGHAHAGWFSPHTRNG